MIKKFALAWEKHERELKEYLRTHKQIEYDSYTELVKLLFDIVINPEEDNASGFCGYNNLYKTDDITVIDDGDYQGTRVFILHRNVYLTTMGDYVHTHVYYGSCSGCDTLLRISNYGSDIPSEEQVEDYMVLCLHLLQNCRFMADVDEEDAEVGE